jgi:hypothetical protein
MHAHLPSTYLSCMPSCMYSFCIPDSSVFRLPEGCSVVLEVELWVVLVV